MSIAYSLSSQQKNNTQLNLEGLGEGNYSKVPNELLEYFATCPDMTARELKMIFFLLRLLNGWQRKEVAVTLEEFMKGTNLDRAPVILTLKKLVKKGLIFKQKKKGERTGYYGFTDAFYRPLVGKPREKSYPQSHLRLVKSDELSPSKVDNLATVKVDNLYTQKSQESATEAGKEAPKDNLKILNLSREDLDKSDNKDWLKVRQTILDIYPHDETFLDSLYLELKKKGVDDRGNPIKSIVGLIASSYEALKANRQTPYKTGKEEKKPEEPFEEASEETSKHWLSFILKKNKPSSENSMKIEEEESVILAAKEKFKKQLQRLEMVCV